MRYLLDFDKRFPGTRTVMMLENYRSAPRVVAVANSLIEKNRERVPKRQAAMRSVHGPTVWRHAKSPDDEAAWIAQGALALHGEGVAYRDMAVLYRAHYASRPVEEALLRAEVPHAVYSGVPFFGRREIKDALSYLRLVAYQDDLDFARVANAPKRNLGARRMAFLREKADELGCSLFEALERFVDDDLFKRTKARQLPAGRPLPLVVRGPAGVRGSGGRAVGKRLRARAAHRGQPGAARQPGRAKAIRIRVRDDMREEVTLEHYLAHTALLTNADAMDDAQDKVRLMTVHAAKGLEFAHVFLCSVTEGVLPSRKTDTPQGMEEERRLAFVAMTRARDGLYLTEAEGRGHEGAPRYPSRFLLDIDPAALEFSNKPAERELDDARAAYALADRWIADLVRDARFAVGDRVTHAAFGSGRVLAVDSQKRAYEVAFDDLDTPRTISFKAKLEQA